jgi:hypothetical protein
MQAGIVILEPCTAGIRVLLVDSQFQVGDVLRHETAHSYSGHTCPNTDDFDLTVVVDASLIWVRGHARRHGNA